MKKSLYYILTLMGFTCVALSVALILIANANQRAQAQVNGQQQYLNQLSQGILGPQGNSVIQDMDTAAGSNANIRLILERYGYRKPSYPTMNPAKSEGIR